jgi:hypothetical protein
MERAPLRPTNRLSLYLASRGLAVYQLQLTPRRHDLSHLAEVEFTDGITDNASNFSFLRQCRNPLRAIMRFMAQAERQFANTYEILPFQQSRHHDRVLRRKNDSGSLRQTDILWLSETEFVSCRKIYINNPFWHYSYSMSVLPFSSGGGDPWMLYAYSIRQPDGSEGPVFAPCSDLAIRFLRRFLTPVFSEFSEFKIRLDSSTPADAVLSLVPTIADDPMAGTKMELDHPSADVLRALASHPIHRRILLQLDLRYDYAHLQELNDLLLGFRFPVHLKVPRGLLCFESSGESFAANPAFVSLTIDTNDNKPLSQKVLDGIARNKHMRDLTLVCWGGDRNVVTGSVLVAFCCGQRRDGTHRRVSLVSNYNDVDRRYFERMECSSDEYNAPFRDLDQSLDYFSTNEHAISAFQLLFPLNRYNPPVKSTPRWDSKFSPCLVLNCLHALPGGCPPASLSGLAIQSINQGILFKHATDLVPADMSVSSASAIFELVHRSMDYDST